AGETVSRPLCAATRERGAGHDRDQQRAGDGKQSPAASRCADVPGDGPHLILRWRAGLSLVAPTASVIRERPDLLIGKPPGRPRANSLCARTARSRTGRNPRALLPCFLVALEIPDFQAYRGSEPPRFANRAELECAKILDYYGVPWLYEPHSFALRWDDD